MEAGTSWDGTVRTVKMDGSEWSTLTALTGWKRSREYLQQTLVCGLACLALHAWLAAYEDLPHATAPNEEYVRNSPNGIAASA